MNNFLVISKSDNNIKSIKSILKKSDCNNNVISANSSNEARRLFLNNEFSVCIIDTPLSDEFGIELSLFIVQNYNCSAILLVKGEIEEDVTAKTEDYGVIVISKPINMQYFLKMIKISISSSRRINNIQSEYKKLQSKIEDLKIIDRAKCLLIENLNLTENQAHKQIEKKAMDSRLTKRAISEKIITKYNTRNRKFE